jgi:hypothetical protein
LARVAGHEGVLWGLIPTQQEPTMTGKCPKCDAVPNVIVEPLRARDENSQRTLPVLQFLCDQCRVILGVTLDPEWQAQVVAGQLRTVGQGSPTSH